MANTRLHERVEIGAGRVDSEGGRIRNVRIIGRDSKNGRTYTQGALEQAATMYEGVSVYVNHRSGRSGDRDLRDKIGWLESVRVSAGEVRGDLCLLLSHPQAAVVLEAATRNPKMLGLSHDAEGATGTRNGRTTVESISRVNSVDLVSNPATNHGGLFESFYFEDCGPVNSDTPFATDSASEEIIRLVCAALIRPNTSDSDKLGRVAQVVRASQLGKKLLSPENAGTPAQESFDRNSLRRAVGMRSITESSGASDFIRGLKSAPEPFAIERRTAPRRAPHRTALRETESPAVLLSGAAFVRALTGRPTKHRNDDDLTESVGPSKFVKALKG
ncbi:MAG: hypothetical protein EXS05_11745 [Planctomycetaceae bacterium]|nr:hypothetical protein [Planctomycetaceae bacterium]